MKKVVLSLAALVGLGIGLAVSRGGVGGPARAPLSADAICGGAGCDGHINLQPGAVDAGGR